MPDTYRIARVFLTTSHILLAVLVQQILDRYNKHSDCDR
jgi:hypothetical protein